MCRWCHPNGRKQSESHSVMSDSLRSHGVYSPWNSSGQNTGVCSLSLLQWIFPTQESNWGLLHLRQILYQLSYQGSPSKYVFTPKLLCFQKLFSSSRCLAISHVERIWYHCCTSKFLLTKKNLSNQQVAQRVSSFENLFGVQTEYSGTEAPWRKCFF